MIPWDRVKRGTRGTGRALLLAGVAAASPGCAGGAAAGQPLAVTVVAHDPALALSTRLLHAPLEAADDETRASASETIVPARLQFRGIRAEWVSVDLVAPPAPGEHVELALRRPRAP